MSSSPFHMVSHQSIEAGLWIPWFSQLGGVLSGSSSSGLCEVWCARWRGGCLGLGEGSQPQSPILLPFAPRSIAAVCLTPPYALPKLWRILPNPKAWGELMWVRQPVQKRGCVVVRRPSSSPALWPWALQKVGTSLSLLELVREWDKALDVLDLDKLLHTTQKGVLMMIV